jgi:glutamate synthase (ferredoxin)
LFHVKLINTLRGNVAWMRAREQLFGNEVYGADSDRIRPIIEPNMSDSASLNNAIETLVHGGPTLPHVQGTQGLAPLSGSPAASSSGP